MYAYRTQRGDSERKPVSSQEYLQRFTETGKGKKVVEVYTTRYRFDLHTLENTKAGQFNTLKQ